MSDGISASDYALWAYRLLLGREPESLEAVTNFAGRDRREIVGTFLASREFQGQFPWIGETRNLWFIVEMANGIRFWVNSDDSATSRALVLGNYKPVETAFVRRHVRRGMNVADIGAGVGWFAVNLASLVGPGGHVDAFEPHPELARYLRRTVAENKFANVAVHQCALAETDGGDTNTPPPDLPADVPVRRLDSMVWGSLHFVRIGAGGAEQLVLNGADLILSRDRPVILSEIDEEALRRVSRIAARDQLRFFEDLDYEVRKILPGGRVGEP